MPDGLEGIAWRELKTLFGERIQRTDTPPHKGTLRFYYTGNPYQLLQLKTVQAVYLLKSFAVPRPKALLGDQHFKALLEQIATVRDLSPAESYRTFHLSAAGSESSVMMRLKTELAAKTVLQESDEEGDLLIRIRRDGEGWESLVRMTPRPLATRSWRVCNREGALNAAVAHAMILLTQPHPDDVFLNMLCGSGTLLIERLTHSPARSAIGYEEDPMALRCAEQNVTAAGFSEQIRLRQGDARDMTLTAKSVDVIVADMPFGNLVGTHESNLTLYPELLNEAARVAKPGARCVIISHEIRLMETLLDESTHWKTEQVIRIMLGGLHPRIFVLRRK